MQPTIRQVAGPLTVDPEARRLLLISYHFPPGPAVGGIRWLRFAPIAAEFGWDLDVICADPATLGRTDDARLDELAPGCRVFGVTPHATVLDGRKRGRKNGTGGPAAAATNGTAPPPHAPSIVTMEDLRWDLHRPEGWRRLLRIWAHVHEEQAWSDAAAGAALVLGQSVRFDAIISSGPPHFAHLASVMAGEKLDCPAVLDFRDPWSTMRAALRGVASKAWPLVNRHFERRAVTGARLMVCNTDLAAAALAARYPDREKAVITVMNGADDESIPAEPKGRFLVAYAGNIYLDRNPQTLFRAARRVIDELALTPEQFGIEFMGNADRLDGRTVGEIATATGVDGHFKQHPVQPHADAIRFLAGATVLVSLPQAATLAIPSKVFEYLSFDAWPLVLAGSRSATATVFRGSSVTVVEPDDEDGIAAFLRERYLRFAGGELPGPVAERDRFSRRGQASILFSAIRRIVDEAHISR